MSWLRCVVALFFAAISSASAFGAEVTNGNLPFPDEAGPGRELKQMNETTCAWDEEAEQCLVSTATVLDFLDEVDNPLSNYLQRAIMCQQATSEVECTDLECHWNTQFCVVPSGELTEFTSAECFTDVEQAVQLNSMIRSCAAVNDVMICENSDLCTWSLETGVCLLDSWRYFYDIPSEDGLPEGFQELVNELETQVNEAVAAGQTSGEIEEPSDILDFNPPAFDCPSGYEQVMCDYAEASTPLFLAHAYCASAYPDASDASHAGCDSDEYCMAVTDVFGFGCFAAWSITVEVSIAMQEVFNEAIEDPLAREYMQKFTECIYALEEDECTGDCYWNAWRNACAVNLRWLLDEIYTSVEGEDDTFCQFYASDVDTGCIEIEDEDTCRADRDCFWTSDTNLCRSGMYAWLDIAFAGTDVEESFSETEDTCLGTPPSECSVSEDEVVSGAAQNDQNSPLADTRTDIGLGEIAATVI